MSLMALDPPRARPRRPRLRDASPALRRLGDRRQRLFDVELVDRADRALEPFLRRDRDQIVDRDDHDRPSRSARS